MLFRVVKVFTNLSPNCGMAEVVSIEFPDKRSALEFQRRVNANDTIDFDVESVEPALSSEPLTEVLFRPGNAKGANSF